MNPQAVCRSPTSTASSQSSTGLRAQGHAIVYISHFLEEVKRIADRVHGAARRAYGGVRGRPPRHTVDELVGMMIGRQLAQLYPRSERRPGEVVLRADRLAAIAEAAGRFVRTPPRRDSGSRRTRRRRPDGTPAHALRPLTRSRGARSPFRPTSGWAIPPCRWRQGAGMVSEDRGNEGLAVALSVADNITMNLSRDAGPLGIDTAAAAPGNRAALDRRIRDQTRGPAQEVSDALRRQPAEGRPGTPAPPGRGHPPARRTDARHRCRQQITDLRTHQPSCGRRPRRTAFCPGPSCWSAATSRNSSACATASRSCIADGSARPGRSGSGQITALLLAATGQDLSA